MNFLTTNRAIIHHTAAEISTTRVQAKPECGGRAVAGWVSSDKTAEAWEKFCPKCFK